jgi:hypothetical protein
MYEATYRTISKRDLSHRRLLHSLPLALPHGYATHYGISDSRARPSPLLARGYSLTTTLRPPVRQTGMVRYRTNRPLSTLQTQDIDRESMLCVATSPAIEWTRVTATHL